ncbi:MAG: BamA/TamA family outer membrane protein [Bacteroidota bacterium]
MKHFFKLDKIFLFAGLVLTSCLGSKFLKNDEQILAKQNIKGISGSLKDDSYALLKKEKNTRFLGMPFAHLAHFYEWGKNGVVFGPKIARKELRLNDKKETINKKIKATESEEKKGKLKERLNRIVEKRSPKIAGKMNATQVTIIPGFNKEKAIANEKRIELKFDRKIERAKNDKRKNKLRTKKARKLDKKRKKIEQGNQVMRWGESLSIYDHNEAKLAAEDIRKYLNSKGFFRATVNIDTANFDSLGSMRKFGRKVRNVVSRVAGAKERYINLDFHVDKKARYIIDSIQYQINDPVLADLVFANKEDSPLQKGYYDQGTISEERNFLYNLAINNGYYEFSKQFVTFRIDSTALGSDTLLIKEIIQNPEGRDQHKIFYIDSVVFVSEASVSQSFKRITETFQDITFSFGRKKYPKRILEWRIPLEQDDKYSREQTIETQRQLSFLDNFKFVNINYDTLGNLFVANIFTSPFDKYQTSSEFGLSSTQGNPGPFVNINLKNRNTFRLLEIISLDLNAKLQDLSSVQDDIESEFTGAYTSRQFGGELAVSFPQFLFPIGNKYQNRIGNYNPNTRISFGIAYEDRVSEYERLNYSGALAYSWQIRDETKYTITPVRISWIDSNNTPDFEDFIDSLVERRNSYANAFRSAVVTSSSFERNQNFGAYGAGDNGAFLKTYLEIGGQFNGLVSNPFFGDSLATFNYIKTNIDARKVDRLTRKYNLAYRINIGYAYPFGDNRGLPYDGYFYAGGSSSIRGWRPRRLGPGSFVTFEVDGEGNETNVIDDQSEQPGEILIESSIELRRDLVGFVEGALFLDAGNVWRIENNSDDVEFDKAVFKLDNFLSQMALAGGTGLRFDLQFLVFRLDLGIRIVDPAKPRNKRFVLPELFNDFNNNSEINIGIGYPF